MVALRLRELPPPPNQLETIRMQAHATLGPYFCYKHVQLSRLQQLENYLIVQRSAKFLVRGLVKFVTAS